MSTVLISAGLAAVITGILYSINKNRKDGKSVCGCSGCSGCSGGQCCGHSESNSSFSLEGINRK